MQRRSATIAQPTVSVLITNYNHGHLLGEAVASALAQTRPADEVVVIDDGSTDESHEVLRRLPPSVRIERQPHRGVVETRNLALRSAASDWIVFLDADDLLHPWFIETTLRAARRARFARVGFVYGPARQTYGHEKGYFRTRGFDARLLARFNFVTNTSLMRRQALLEVGGYSLDMESIGHEDWDVFLSLAERGWRGVLVPRPLFTYRVQPGGRNEESTAAWDRVQKAIRRRHPWTALPVSTPERVAVRLRRIVPEARQSFWCAIDRMRWQQEP